MKLIKKKDILTQFYFALIHTMSTKNNNVITPFSVYRLGYVDGYEGNNQRFPEDEYYIRGYEEGEEDDRLGGQKKFIIYISHE
jgi:hypothetical protein